MGYKVKLAGETEPLTIPDVRGHELYKDFIQKTMPEIIEINGTAYRSTEIRKIWRAGIDRVHMDISKEEVFKLKKNLRDFEQKKINGMLVSRFDQYLISIGIIRMVGQEFWVRDPAGYTAAQDLYGALEKHEYGLAKGLEEVAGAH